MVHGLGLFTDSDGPLTLMSTDLNGAEGRQGPACGRRPPRPRLQVRLGQRHLPAGLHCPCPRCPGTTRVSRINGYQPSITHVLPGYGHCVAYQRSSTINNGPSCYACLTHALPGYRPSYYACLTHALPGYGPSYYACCSHCPPVHCSHSYCCLPYSRPPARPALSRRQPRRPPHIEADWR